LRGRKPSTGRDHRQCAAYRRSLVASLRRQHRKERVMPLLNELVNHFRGEA
jgi:hypothetical protein